MIADSNNNKKKTYIRPVIILLCTIIIVFFGVPKLGNFIINNYISVGNLAPVNGDGQSSSGVQVIEVTGDKIIAPSNPRDYIDYIIQNGQQGKDYFIIYPDKQPNITSSNKAENNTILRQYAYKYRYIVNLGDIRGGYIMFTTRKIIKDNRSLFLTINGSSKGALSMVNKEDGYYDNEYVYNITSISAGGYELNLLNYISDGKLTLGGYVGETGNGIEKIIIVKKK